MNRSGKTILAWFTGLLAAGFFALFISPNSSTEFKKNALTKKVSKIRYQIKKTKALKRQADRENPDCFI